MLLADSPTEEKKPETRGRKSIITTEMIDACRELIELSGGKITLKSAQSFLYHFTRKTF